MQPLEIENVSEAADLVDQILYHAGHYRDPVKVAKHLNRQFCFDDRESRFWKAKKFLRETEHNRILIQKEKIYKDQFLQGPVVLDVGTNGSFLEDLRKRHPGKYERLIGTNIIHGPWSTLKAPYSFIFQKDQEFPLDKIGKGVVNSVHLCDVLHHIYPAFADPSSEKAFYLVTQYLKDIYHSMVENGHLVIIEESFPNSWDPAFEAAPEMHDPKASVWRSRFLQLSTEQRYQFLVWDDWLWALLYGALDSEEAVFRMPYRYFTMERWLEIFRKVGFKVKTAQYWAFRSIYLFSSNEVFFVLQK